MEPNTCFKLNTTIVSAQRPKTVQSEFEQTQGSQANSALQKIGEHLAKVVTAPDESTMEKKGELVLGSQPEQISPERGVTVRDGTGRVLSLGREYIPPHHDPAAQSQEMPSLPKRI